MPVGGVVTLPGTPSGNPTGSPVPASTPPPPSEPLTVVPSPTPSLRDRLTGRSRPRPDDQPVVVLHDVTMRYPNGKEALKDVELVVPEGDFVFLVGPSGAGKSTLTKWLIRH